jgi:Short-chain dehydrogenases of various substrate specificities
VAERVTLITGASAGIGMELARVFAANGHRLALTARRADRLEALANELAAKGGKKPIVIACDLEKADAGETIAAALAAEGVELDHLVNNAGFGVFGDAIERDRIEQIGIVDVNVRALTDLSLRFADQLIRNKGGLLNVGSVAGFLPGPGMAVYYASKAYVISLTEALRAELHRAASASPCFARVRCRPNSRSAPALDRNMIRPFSTSLPPKLRGRRIVA